MGMTLARSCAGMLRRGLLSALLCGSLPASAAVHALLIGVSDYKESNLRDLLGPPNDVALMTQVLTGRFAIPKAQVTVLLNPTHTAVEQAFAALAGRVRPNDQVYVQYSGHGATAVAPLATADPAGERRGQDQTWVVHGSRSGKRAGKDALDVLDKEIALWLDALYRITPNVVVVSDSCHSAGVTRDAQRGVRSADAAPGVHPLRASIKLLPEPQVGLRIGAARDYESAVELDPRANAPCFDPRHCYGVFTWHWARALQASRPGESWGDVFRRASASITATPRVIQAPQIHGVADRAVFEGKFAPLSALLPVTEVQADGTVKLGAGMLSGVTVDSEFTAADTPAGPGARVRITATAAAASVARLVSGKLSAGDVVQETRHAYKDAPTRVFVGGPQAATVDAELVKLVRVSIEEARKYALAGFEVVPRREQADWRLEILRPDARQSVVAGALPINIPCDREPCAAPELWVLSPLGQLMHPKMRFLMARPQDEMPRLLMNLASFGHAREVRGFAAQGNDTPLQAQVSVLRPSAGNTAKCAEGAKGATGWERIPPVPIAQLASAGVRLGDCLAFKIVNRDPGRPWYGYLFAVDPNFRVQKIWPFELQNDDEARIEPATTYAIPDTFYKLVDEGRESVMFVASDSPSPMARLMTPGLRSAAVGGTPSRLNRLLDAGALTRGETESSRGSLWGAQAVDLDLAAARP